jgi:uncharacterized protein DUF4386
MNTNKKTAKIAGIFYLLVIAFGIFAQVVRQSFIVTVDATVTANNILNSELLFRFSFISDLFMITSYFLLGVTFYVLFKSVNNNISLVLLVFVLISSAIAGINMLNHFAVLQLLSGADYLAAFEAEQLFAQVMFHLDMHEAGAFIAQIFGWGPWLFPLGYLGYKSGYFPRILSILLMLACFGLLIEGFVYFLIPDYKVITYPGLAIATIAEFWCCGWLLIKGVKD